MTMQPQGHLPEQTAALRTSAGRPEMEATQPAIIDRSATPPSAQYGHRHGGQDHHTQGEGRSPAPNARSQDIPVRPNQRSNL
jgi:hypothetical protein